jgi:heterodisulfide reductase subunit C
MTPATLQPAIRTEAERDPAFATWIREVPGAENIAECIHCGQCSGSCPLSTYMDRSPRQLMHLAKEGFKDDVLSSLSIWLCTSCYECTVKCPHGIGVTEVMYALKRRAIEEEKYPKGFTIPLLAREFHDMVVNYGRVSEARLITGLLLKTSWRRLFRRAGQGWAFFRTGRVSTKRESIRGRRELKQLVEAMRSNGKGAAA